MLTKIKDILFKTTQDKRLVKAFWSSAFFGMLCYSYCFMNLLFNWDNILYEPYGVGVGITSGRWALQILGKVVSVFWGVCNIPLFNGLIAILILAIVSCLIVLIFDIKNEWYCALIGMLTVSFPSIAGVAGYGFTIHYYAFSIFLAVFSVFLLKKWGNRIWSYALGIFLAAISLGIYQSYFPLLICLLLILLVKISMEKQNTANFVFFKALKFLAFIVLSYLLYYITLNIILKVTGLELSGYLGVSEMGKIDIAALPRKILECYKNTISILFKNYVCITGTRVIRISLRILYIIMAFCVCIFLAKSWKINKVKTLLSLLFFLMFPLALNFMHLTSPPTSNFSIHSLMLASFLSLFYLPIILIEDSSILESLKNIFKNFNLTKFLRGTISVILFAVSINYSWQVIGAYRQLDFIDRRIVNYYSELYTKARSVEGFSADKKIVILGTKFKDESFNSHKFDDPIYLCGITDYVGLNLSKGSIVANFLGYKYYEAQKDTEEYREYLKNEDSLKIYPDNGSIKLVNDEVLVRIE